MLNSLTGSLTPDSIANDAKIKRDTAERKNGLTISTVIVEGDADQRFYSIFLTLSRCVIINAHGKQKAINVLRIIQSRKTKGVLCIVDDDYDTLMGVKIEDDNVVVTDTHDLETFLFSSGALKKLLSQPLETDHLIYLDELTTKTRQSLIRITKPLGFARWMFASDCMDACINKVALKNVIDLSSQKMDVPSLIREIIKINKDIQLEETDLLKKLESFMENDVDPWLLCRGHDLMGVLKIVYPSLYSKFVPKDKVKKDNYLEKLGRHFRDEKEVTKLLIHSVERSEFEKSGVYKGLQKWEKNNPDYITYST